MFALLEGAADLMLRDAYGLLPIFAILRQFIPGGNSGLSREYILRTDYKLPELGLSQTIPCSITPWRRSIYSACQTQERRFSSQRAHLPAQHNNAVTT